MDYDRIHSLFVSEKFTHLIKCEELSQWLRTYSYNFMCSICRCILQDTMSLKNCMHKFCETCIKSSINSRNRRCPICHASITTAREMCRDHTYDAVKHEFYAFWENHIKNQHVIEDTHLHLVPSLCSVVTEILSLKTNGYATSKFIMCKCRFKRKCENASNLKPP